MKDLFVMLAHYNKWANQRLYAAAALVPERQYFEDRGAFFGSLHGTLNHLIVGDRIWMARFLGNKNEPTQLDGILYEDLSSLRTARAQEDERIIAYLVSLTQEALADTIRYRSTRNPTEIRQYLAPLLIHFFNHQTHHRGQAHAIVTGILGKAPSLDLFIYQRQTGESIVAGAGGQFEEMEMRPV